jgi:hypothetical protein
VSIDHCVVLLVATERHDDVIEFQSFDQVRGGNHDAVAKDRAIGVEESNVFAPCSKTLEKGSNAIR